MSAKDTNDELEDSFFEGPRIDSDEHILREILNELNEMPEQAKA